MEIYTVWGVRKVSPEEPELVTAWDEYSVDNNPEGYDEDVRRGLASWGDDLLTFRAIRISIPDSAVQAAFGSTMIEGSVE